MTTWNYVNKSTYEKDEVDFVFSDGTDFVFSDSSDFVFSEAIISVLWSHPTKSSTSYTYQTKN
jgi:hypothetical protein